MEVSVGQTILLVFAAALLGRAADDDWAKVKDLRGGTELRIVKKGSVEPVIGLMADADDERLVIVIKNAQQSILKANIDRLDYRPKGGGHKLTRESKIEKTDRTEKGPPPRGPEGTAARGGSGDSYSTNLGIANTTPGFETIYRRRPLAPAKK
jgi:hypothetical protein